VLKAEVASGEATKARQESVSSESGSDEEAEYQPNLPSPISHALIPEEKEEELEKEEEVEEEQKPEEVEKQCVEPAPITKEATPLPVEASQPAEAVEEKEMENGTEGKKVETQDSTDDPMVTPDEVPNGHALPEEGGGATADAVSAPAAPEEEEAKVNGESSSLTDAAHRPQVICCSEVIGSMGRSGWSFADLLRSRLPTLDTARCSCIPQPRPTPPPAPPSCCSHTPPHPSPHLCPVLRSVTQG